jgi:pimeloyl-ACP methyl ester carboxylesterase
VIRARTLDEVNLALTCIPSGRQSSRAALLIPGFGQNRYMFDMPARSLASYLAHSGVDAYILELRGHGRSRVCGGPYARSVAEYADLDLPAALQAVRERGAREVFLVGHSMGGMTCMAAPRELLSSVQGVVIIASPTHVGRGAPFVRLLARTAMSLLRASRGGRPPPHALATEILGGFFQNTLFFFDTPLPWPVHIWEPGQIERELLRDYLGVAFDREAMGALRDLARWCERGTFDRTPGGECIRERLRDYPVPILFIAGKQDRLVPPSSMRPGFELTRAPRKAWRLFGEREHRGRYGHVDLLLGRHAPVEVWPHILEWLAV